MEPYLKHVEYRFEAEGQIIAASVLEDSPDGYWLSVEDVRKNGQEDTHMSGVVVLSNDGWRWDDNEGGSLAFDTYGSDGIAQAIIDYLNEHPHPDLHDQEGS